MNADDDGVTLVELIIYIVVTSLFLGLLALMFVNGLRAQAQTTDRDSATGQSNVVSSSIQTSLRNATAFTITSANRALIAKVSTPGGGRECRAWVVTTGGDVRYRVAASGPISTSNTSTWTVLVDGDAASGDGAHPSLSRRDGTDASGKPKFVPIDADGDGLTDAFSRNGQTLSYGLEITRGDATVVVSNGVTAQAAIEGTDTLTCW